jgi:hypothetical protein
MVDGFNLPPLPGSDDKTLKENKFDPFYKKTPRDFWEGNVINHTEVEEKEKCGHFFEYSTDGVKCTLCHIGLIGKELQIKDGHVFFKNQKLL